MGNCLTPSRRSSYGTTRLESRSTMRIQTNTTLRRAPSYPGSEIARPPVMCFVSSTRSLSAGSTLGMLVQWSDMQISLPRFGDCGSRTASPLQMRSRTVGVTVRRKRRWTSAGATPARKLLRPSDSNASSRPFGESFEMHVHASCADYPERF